MKLNFVIFGTSFKVLIKSVFPKKLHFKNRHMLHIDRRGRYLDVFNSHSDFKRRF